MKTLPASPVSGARPREAPHASPPLQVRSSERFRINSAAFLILALPVVIYLFSLWVVYPLPFSYATPFLLLPSLFLIKVPRAHVIESLRRVGWEFFLLASMILLSLLSLANSDAPFRSFRIIFPCAVPFLIFVHLMVVSSVSRSFVLWIPRLLLVAGFTLSVMPFLASFVLPPLKSLVFEEYRLKCLFEISIQNSIALAILMPLLVTELVITRRRGLKVGLFLAALVLAYTMFRAGSKTAMSIGLLAGLLTFIALKIREQSLVRNVSMALCLIACGGFLWMFGLDIAEKLEPETAQKLRTIIKGGVTSYQSVQIRRHLWEVSLEEGRTHWLVGSGAGEIVLGYPHAHNLVLDYFKGIGLFGALAIILLCLTILVRMVGKGITVLRGKVDDSGRRIFACYVSASVYVLCNQMSDCFGPSTVGFLWTVYLVGILADASRGSRPLRRPAWTSPG